MVLKGYMKRSHIPFAGLKTFELTFFAACLLAALSGPAPAEVRAAGNFVETASEAADTVAVTLQQAETLFLERNLLLMAERMNMDIAEAEIRQARLWKNPEVEIEHQIINRAGSGPVGFTGSDNTVFEIEQEIFSSGTRRQTVRLREMERMAAEHRFDLVLRESKRILREQFFELAFLNRAAGLYREQIDALSRIRTGFEEQLEEGNIALAEVLRIRSLQLELTEEYHAVLRSRDEVQDRLRLFIHLDEGVTPDPVLPPEIGRETVHVPHFLQEELLQIAMRHRHDLRALTQESELSAQRLRVERTRAYPDVGIGLVYDRLDGPIDDYFGLMVNFQVPIWNRNQGHIEAQRHRIRQTELRMDRMQQQIFYDIERSLKRLERSIELLGQVDSGFEQDFSVIITQMLRRYQDGEIRLIEFIDFYDSFREAMIRSWSIQEEFLKAVEDLNMTVGIDLVPFEF